MAIKGKITRLGDPANPYSKPKVVITDSAKMKPAVVKKAVVVTPAKKAPGLIDNLIDSGKAKMQQIRHEQTEGRRKAIDEAVDGKQRPRK